MMKKIYFRKTQRLFYLLLFIGLFLFTSCSRDDENIMFPIPTQSIYEVIKNKGEFDSILNYMELYPELKAKLDGPGNYTFFAPDNDAFIELLSSNGFPADIRDINPDIIKNMIEYHIVENSVIKQNEFGSQLTTLSSEIIKVNADNTLLTGAIDKHISITEGDIEATNGVVHIVESVLVPPSTSAEALGELLNTIAGAALLSDDFSYFGRLVNSVDEEVSEKDKLRNLLKGPGIDVNNDGSPDGLSVLFPPNKYFEVVADARGVTVETLLAELTAESDELRRVLKTHIIAGKLTISELEDNLTITSLSGTNLIFKQVPVSENTPLGYIIVTETDIESGNPIPLVAGDIQVINGYIHIGAGLFTK